MRTVEAQDQRLYQTRPDVERRREFVLKLAQLVDEVKDDKLATAWQIFLKPFGDGLYKECVEGSIKEMSRNSGIDLLPQVLAADELNQVLVIVIEHLLQILEHPCWLLRIPQLRMTDEEVTHGFADGLPV